MSIVYMSIISGKPRKTGEPQINSYLQELNRRFSKLSAGETLLVRLTAKVVLDGTETFETDQSPFEQLQELLPIMTAGETELYQSVLKIFQEALSGGLTEKLSSRKTGYSIRSRSIHPPIKDEKGHILANNPLEFTRKNGLKYTGMLNGIDAITASRSPSGEDFNHHFSIIEYTKNGIVVRKTAGPGYRTYSDEVEAWRRKEGLPPIRRPKAPTPKLFNASEINRSQGEKHP